MIEQDFFGKVAVVTGASRGIGRTIALALAQRGARVVISARRMDTSEGTGGTLAETLTLINEGGSAGLAIPAQIVTPEGSEYLAAQAMEVFGRIDILVNNAGIYPDVRIAEMDPLQWDEMIAINVTAPFLMCRAVLPHMVNQKSGNILNISSGSALNYSEGHVAYSASKAAINTYSAFLAEELREHEIAVNALMPGLIRTDMNLYRGEEPDVVVPSVMWILSQTHRTFTGQVVRRRDFGSVWGSI